MKHPGPTHHLIQMSSRLRDLAQRIRVPLGFLFAALFLIFSRPRPLSAIIGFIVALAGLAIRLWAAGCIEKSRRLEVAGPYQYTRNPLYLGSFVLGIGGCIAAANAWLLLPFVALFAAIYGPVMKREEEEMQKLFSEEFTQYQRLVPLFMPRMGPQPGTGNPEPEITAASRFGWSRVIRNREYNAVVGFLALFAWIFFRLWKN